MYQDILKHKIKEMRVQKGFTQYEVASQLEVSQGTYNNWETGRRLPALDKIIKIADMYDIELDYLFGRDIRTAKRIKYDN